MNIKQLKERFVVPISAILIGTTLSSGLFFGPFDTVKANEISAEDNVLLTDEQSSIVNNLGSAKEEEIATEETLKNKEAYDKDISSIGKQVEDLINLKELYKNNSSSLKEDIIELKDRIEKTENKIVKLKETIQIKESEIEETQIELLSLYEEIKKMEIEKSEREEDFKGRLKSIQKNKELGLVELLVESKTFGDMINRFFNYKTIVEADNKQIEEYLNLLEKLDKAKVETERLKSKLEKDLSKLETEKSKLDSEMSELEDLKVRKERQSMSTAEILSSIDKDINTLKTSKTNLEQNKDKAVLYEELQNRLSKAISEGISNKSIYKYTDLTTKEYVSNKLEEEQEQNKIFVTPTEGTFTSGYGPRIVMGEYGFHSGIDLANKTGTEIISAAEGKVIHAGVYSSYGNAIFISHSVDGIDYVTVYGHLSLIGVKKGDIVEQGTVIGLMGSTGRSTGPHLHFEIQPNTASYVYKKAVDPWKYLTSNLSAFNTRNVSIDDELKK